MFEVRPLQDLARIAIRHTLKTTASQPTRLRSERGGARSGARARPKRRRTCRRADSLLLANRHAFVSRTIPRKHTDDGCDRSETDEEAEEEEGVVERRVDLTGEEVGRESRPDTPVNLLRERILGLPLPEPLKMYLLYYRQK